MESISINFLILYFLKSKLSAMSNLKSQILNLKSSNGFTLIELLVVISIMALLLTAISINLSGQRSKRDIKIAQNLLVSDVRKIQSYTLSSRNLASGKSAQYYILKIDLSKPGQYVIQAITDSSSQPKVEDIETIRLPSNIKIFSVTVNRSRSPVVQGFTGTDCALAAFATPFGKIIFNKGCQPTGTSGTPLSLSSGDDYWGKIVNFQTNIDCDGANNPSACSASSDSIMTVVLSDSGGSMFKSVNINSVTGAVTSN